MTQTLLATTVRVILERALEAQFGLQVRITVRPGEDIAQPVLRARALLYHFRAQLAPAYDGLQIRLHPQDPDHRLWLIKRSAVVQEAEAEATEQKPKVARSLVDLF